MNEHPDTHLLDAACSGDIESYGELCRRYYPPLVAIAYAVLGDHHAAEDAAQETFARALVRLRDLRKRSRFGSWLGRICRNVARDMAKARARQVAAGDLAEVPDEGDCEHQNHAVLKAIGRLRAPAREVIVLRYYQNLSYERIGAVLGLSKAAINGRLIRARRKIARYLRNLGEMT